jgi:hypothetical protein
VADRISAKKWMVRALLLAPESVRIGLGRPGDEGVQARLTVAVTQVCQGFKLCFTASGQLPATPVAVPQRHPGPIHGHRRTDCFRVGAGLNVGDQGFLHPVASQGGDQRLDQLPVTTAALVMNDPLAAAGPRARVPPPDSVRPLCRSQDA